MGKALESSTLTSAREALHRAGVEQAERFVEASKCVSEDAA
jgi:hypothetical protein